MKMTIRGKIAAAILGASMLTPVFAAAEPAKVGMITTLSGGGSSLGVDVRDGFLLAVKQSGSEDLEVLVEDDARKPDQARKIADKFLQKDKVDILTGIIWSNLAMATVPAVTKQGVFYISPNAGPSALAGKNCHENYFNAAWQNDNLHEAMGSHATGAGYTKPFILAPNYPAGKDALTGFKRFFKGEPVGEIYTKLGQTDYAAEIAQIRDSGADSIFFFLPGGMGIAFMKQYSQSGIDVPVMGPAFSFSQDILPAMGDAAVGVINSAQWSKDLDNPANKAFVEAFEAEYGRLPSLYASQGFDTANLILSAMKTASPKDADAFREALRKAEFESTRGEFKFGSNHHPVQDIYVREVIKDGDVITNKIIGVGLEEHTDAYASECKM